MPFHARLGGMLREDDHPRMKYRDVSKNRGTPKSSILIGFSIINHPFWGTPISGNTHISGDPDEPLIHRPEVFFAMEKKSRPFGRGSPPSGTTTNRGY